MVDALPPEMDRYSRQILFAPLGLAGQERMMRARVTLIGCGALGTVLASTLVRAGVGFLRLCDRDYIETNNLQRQILFDEDDIARGLPKAVAAAEKLRRINSRVDIEPVVTDVNSTNVTRLVERAELILDGTDNFETRYLLNDVAVKQNLPWIYGAVIGATGLVLAVLPDEGPCLRCVFESAPPPELNPTCDTAGVLGPAASVVASLQAVEALKLLAGRRDLVNRTLASVDVWSGRVTQLHVANAKTPACPCCGQRRFAYLDGDAGSQTTTLCGRDAVQVRPIGNERKVDLARIATKLQPVAAGPVVCNRFMLRATIERYTLSVFPDGRAIVKGTTSPDEARAVYARYIGS